MTRAMVSVAPNIEIVNVNGWAPLGDQVRQDLRRTASHRPAKRSVACVQPQVGTPSGTECRCAVPGHRPNPAHSVAREMLPALGKRALTTISRVLRRCGFNRRSKPDSSAMPPTRIRSLNRVMAILYVSSITVDTGAASLSRMGTVSEKPLTG